MAFDKNSVGIKGSGGPSSNLDEETSLLNWHVTLKEKQSGKIKHEIAPSRTAKTSSNLFKWDISSCLIKLLMAINHILQLCPYK